MSGLCESPEAVRSLASMVISFTFPSRPHSSRRSSSSFASRQSSTMRGICTTLSAPGRRVSNGSFHGTFRNASLQRTFGSVRTAEIGGRSRQAEDDHQGRVGSELAVVKSYFNQKVCGGLTLSGHRDPLLRKAIAERLGEKVRGEDDLREVAKSAVWADTPIAASNVRHPAAACSQQATTVQTSLHRQERTGRGGCGHTRARRDTLLAEPDDHVPVYSVQAFAAHRPGCVRVVDVRINLARVEVILVERIVDSDGRRREMRTACKVRAHLANEKKWILDRIEKSSLLSYPKQQAAGGLAASACLPQAASEPPRFF